MVQPVFCATMLRPRNRNAPAIEEAKSAENKRSKARQVPYFGVGFSEVVRPEASLNPIAQSNKFNKTSQGSAGHNRPACRQKEMASPVPGLTRPSRPEFVLGIHPNDFDPTALLH